MPLGNKYFNSLKDNYDSYIFTKPKPMREWSTGDATWNVILLAGNERKYYDQVMAATSPFTAVSAEALARKIWPTGKTDDGHKLSDVNWQQVADDWNDK